MPVSSGGMGHVSFGPNPTPKHKPSAAMKKQMKKIHTVDPFKPINKKRKGK